MTPNPIYVGEDPSTETIHAIITSLYEQVDRSHLNDSADLASELGGQRTIERTHELMRETGMEVPDVTDDGLCKYKGCTSERITLSFCEEHVSDLYRAVHLND